MVQVRPGYSKVCLWLVGVVMVIAAAGAGLAFYQGRQDPRGRPEYVALGSSFAAGAGLGALEPGSPLLCARSVNGYPQQLSRLLHLEIVDMSCGGAVSGHLLDGGQFFQGPQIRTIGHETRLVTITVGGNDVGYVGDLSLLAARRSGSLFGRGVQLLWSGPRTEAERDFPRLARTLPQLLAAIRKRAPDATIVMATYPAILPEEGTCPVIGLSAEEAAAMREVAGQLAETTRAAAEAGGAILVDMNALGRGHDACSAQPWARGWSNGEVAPFHPTMLGAEATARAIAEALNRSPH